MATSVSRRSSERTAMERFGGGGMALLPWTKHILTVLWEQLRLLVQVIYYTFMSVFQMFRFEVHVRITDETGEHIQHMSSAASSPDSFLFSSVVGGSSPLSNFCSDVGDAFAGKSPAEALLSSLRADELCCGLVDDLVSGGEDGLFLGHQAAWKMGFPGDWNIFVSNGDGCRTNGEKVSKQETSEEERSSHWSSEEDQSAVEFDSEESKALWESLSRSSDPYNPFFFSACISTRTDETQSEARDADATAAGRDEDEAWRPPGLNIWVCRSDSESSWSSWAGSDGSSPDVDREESDRLWDLFSSPEDPYNPLCFTASSSSNQQPPPPPPSRPEEEEEEEEEEEGSSPPSDDEEELLWKCLSQRDDPYHPLNFRASVQSPPVHHEDVQDAETTKKTRTSRQSRVSRPDLPQRSKRHAHPDKIMVPWKRPGPAAQTPPDQDHRTRTAQKQVRFSPVVQVHVMRTWPFARQASRKGPWEEAARDRDRFRRRIAEAERSIGYCLTPSHREKIQAHLEVP